jgi:hypothetical protein
MTTPAVFSTAIDRHCMALEALSSFVVIVTTSSARFDDSSAADKAA